MAKGRVVDADLEFIRFLKKSGADSFKKCFQCATCSTVCPLSPSEKPFPRKEMLMAGWGQADKLVKSTDIWLCYQCNDCSVDCLRDGKPGDVLAAIRSYVYQRFSIPSFMGKALFSPAALPLLLLGPMAVLAAMVWAHTGGNWAGMMEGPIVFSEKFLPMLWIDILFMTTTALAGLSLAVGLWRFWHSLESIGGPKRMALVPAAIAVVTDIVFHLNFFKCDANKARGFGHALLFAGMGAAFVTTMAVMVAHYIFGMNTPIPLSHWIKWVGNFAAVTGVLGGLWLLLRRVIGPAKVGANGYQDWLFMIVILLAFATGLSTEMARLREMAAAAYLSYYVHLVVVFFLLVYAPYSKFAHMFYRALALVHARAAGRQQKMPAGK